MSERIFQQIREVAESNKGEYYETTFNWKGELLHFMDYRYPIKNDEGKIYAVGTIGRNVTKKMIASEKLEVSENKYFTLFEKLLLPLSRQSPTRRSWM